MTGRAEPSARRRGERGMSLVELLVAVALSALVMVFGLALLMELQGAAKVSVAEGPRVGGSTDAAVEHVVHDVRSAADVLTRAGDYHASGTTLLLLLPSGERVVHEVVGRRHVRSVAAAGEDDFRSRTLAEDVTLLDFAIDGRTVQVTLARQGEPTRQRLALLRNVGAERGPRR